MLGNLLITSTVIGLGIRVGFVGVVIAIVALVRNALIVFVLRMV